MMARGVRISTPKAISAATSGNHEISARATRTARASRAGQTRKPVPRRRSIMDAALPARALSDPGRPAEVQSERMIVLPAKLKPALSQLLRPEVLEEQERARRHLVYRAGAEARARRRGDVAVDVQRPFAAARALR